MGHLPADVVEWFGCKTARDPAPGGHSRESSLGPPSSAGKQGLNRT
jgi:hypothetical protein